MPQKSIEYLKTLVTYLGHVHNLPEEVIDIAIYNVLNLNTERLTAKAKAIAMVYITAIKKGYYIPIELLANSLDYKKEREINKAKQSIIKIYPISTKTIVDLFGRLFALKERDKNILKKEVENTAKTEQQKISITFAGAVLYRLSKEGKIRKKLTLAEISEKLNKPAITLQKINQKLKNDHQ